MSAAEVRDRLLALRAERALALASGRPLDGDEDLDDEIRAAEAAFVGTAVTEIAVLRAELSGRLQG
jgi:hypothetical protein